MSPHRRLVIWFSLMALTQVVYVVNNVIVRRARLRGELYATAAILPVVGAGWGAGPFLVTAEALATARASMVLVFVCAVAAASVVSLAAFRSLFIGFAAPMFGITGLGYALHGPGLLRVVLPAGAVLMLTLMVIYNAQAAHTLTAAMRFRHRAALVAERREWEATHDALTGLLDRGGLFRHADGVAEEARREGLGYAFVFLDVDDFKRVNDEGGHEVGDEVLRELARRLAAACSTGDAPARLGGDEFVVLAGHVASVAQAIELAHRVHDGVVGEPFVVDGRSLAVAVSVGVAVSPAGTDEPGDLLGAADRAMYRAKDESRSAVVVYDETLRRQSEDQLTLDRELRAGVERGEIVAYAQPVVELSTGRLCGVELLARWVRPGVGVVAAAGFIDAAERVGLVVEISRRILEHAGVVASRWRGDPALGDLTIAVNVAARHLRGGELSDDVRRVVAAHPALRDRLVLELTETEMVENLQDAVTVLSELVREGATVAIDDFGQGYSSLAYLNRLPAALVKIDRQFVAAMTTDEGSRAVVHAAVGLARAFGRETVAEGIETVEVACAAGEAGCRFGQGYLFGRPMPLADLEALARQGIPAAAAG
jgi:diguanylate cyclase (GGDEF)-like protein